MGNVPQIGYGEVSQSYGVKVFNPHLLIVETTSGDDNGVVSIFRSKSYCRFTLADDPLPSNLGKNLAMPAFTTIKGGDCNHCAGDAGLHVALVPHYKDSNQQQLHERLGAAVKPFG